MENNQPDPKLARMIEGTIDMAGQNKRSCLARMVIFANEENNMPIESKKTRVSINQSLRWS